MNHPGAAARSSSASVTVRYWASARAAAGRDTDQVEASTLAEALSAVLGMHADSPRFAEVLDVCALLVDSDPVGSRDRAQVLLADGATVEVLPPFAGG